MSPSRSLLSSAPGTRVPAGTDHQLGDHELLDGGTLSDPHPLLTDTAQDASQALATVCRTHHIHVCHVDHAASLASIS